MRNHDFHQTVESLDKMAEWNRIKLIAIANTARIRNSPDGRIWGATPVRFDDKPWKFRVLKMIHDLCWFYDRMEGHQNDYLSKEFNLMVKRMNERNKDV